MFAAGVRGYIRKECTVEELLEAVHAVAANRTYLCSEISRTVQGLIGGERAPAPGSTRSPLTRRELEVLQRISVGQATKQIAVNLGVSAKTVATHREHIMTKLGIHTVAGLTRHAVDEGLVAPSTLAPNSYR